MSDQDALLAAIRQAPQDDAPRLIYADWLDEHGDPDRAEFIRLQIEIDPFRRPNSDLDRWRRAVIHSYLDDPVPTDFPAELHRYADLARREDDLLREYRWTWLAPLSELDNDLGSHLSVKFHRGFAEEVALATSAFLDEGDLIRSTCPLLRRLTLYGPREQMPELVGVPALGNIAELELAGWITDYDARYLASSFALESVRSLTLWIGSRHDQELVRTLARVPWEGGPAGAQRPLLPGTRLPDLREVVLVQLSGGIQSDNLHGGLDRRADSLAGEFNRIFGRAVARVERPFERRFPLFKRVGPHFHAGHIRERPTVIATGRRSDIFQFGPNGHPITEDSLDLDDRLSRLPGSNRNAYDEAELVSLLCREHDFRPGVVFVREFSSEDREVTVHLWGSYQDVVSDPDGRSDGDEHEDACATLSRFWMHGGHFVVDYGRHIEVGPDGVERPD